MKKYMLAELLTECDDSAPMPDDMEDWINMPNVGFEKIYIEDLQDYDTPACLIDDERIIDFLRDIIKERDPALLDHAVSLIKRRWKDDSELNVSVSEEKSLQSDFASEVETKYLLANPKNGERLLEAASEIEAGNSKKQ